MFNWKHLWSIESVVCYKRLAASLAHHCCIHLLPLWPYAGLTILQGDMITVMADSTTKIMCTTDLPVNELQWLLGDQLLFSSSGAMEIELTVPLDGDDEYTLQVFTCKSIHTNGNQTASINVTYILRMYQFCCNTSCV